MVMDHISETALEPPNNVDFAFDRVEEFTHTMQKFYQWISRVLKIKECQASARLFINDHPILSVFIGVAMAMCSVPIFSFFVFAVTTAAILFMGFLLVEGAVIAFGLMILFSILFCVIFLSIGCSILILFAYYIAVFIRQLSTDLKQRMTSRDAGSHAD